MTSEYTQDVARCEDQLRKLLARERERDTIASLRARSRNESEIDRLLNAALPGSETSASLLDRIISNLAIDTHITAKLKVAVKEYDVAVCRLVGSQMQERLPRELRDMMLEYLVPENIFLCAKRSFRGVLLHVHNVHGFEDGEFDESGYSDDSRDSDDSHDSEFDNDDHDGHCEDDEYSAGVHPYIPLLPHTQRDPICSQHYWRDEIIGAETARELAETFYRTSNFHIEATCATSTSPDLIISELSDKDRFGLGITPAQWISHVSLELDIQRIGLSEDSSLQNPAMLLQWIKSLGKLKDKAEIAIRIRRSSHIFLMWEEPSESVLDNALELMLPELVNLRRAGYRLRVSASSRWFGLVEDVIEKWMGRLEREASQ